jgi:hypothetical protein
VVPACGGVPFQAWPIGTRKRTAESGDDLELVIKSLETERSEYRDIIRWPVPVP